MSFVGPRPDVPGYAFREGYSGMQVEQGRWHRLVAHESGTVIIEAKDGAYEPIWAEDMEGSLPKNNLVLCGINLANVVEKCNFAVKKNYG